MVGQLLTVTLALSATRQVDGVGVPDTVQIQRTSLRLNGAGTRVAFMFRLYVAALYVPEPSSSASVLLTGGRLQHVRLTQLRDLDEATVRRGFVNAIARAAGPDAPAWLERFRPFLTALRAAHTGEVVDISFVPGRGVVLRAAGATAEVPGDDASRLLLSIWIGDRPVDDVLKSELLGAHRR